MEDQHSVHPAELGIRATLIGIVVNLSLALAKGAAGVFGNSYALIADAVESMTDVFSSLVVWWGLRASTRPADGNHPFGHGKIEPIAASFVGFFLIAAAGGVAWQSFHEILSPHELPKAWTLLVLLVVVILKTALSRFTHSVATEISSTAVKGDAWHHQSDAITSAAAFIGISVALIGSHYAPDPYWSSADDWAALFASGVIALNGYSVLRSSYYELSDPHPGQEIEATIRGVAGKVGGVAGLHKCFIHKVGFDYYVELDVLVDRNLPVYRGHEIAHAVQDAVKAGMPTLRIARVLVHIEPSVPGKP